MKRYILAASLLLASQCHAMAPTGNDTVLLFSPDDNIVYNLSGCIVLNETNDAGQVVAAMCNYQSQTTSNDNPTGTPVAFAATNTITGWQYQQKNHNCQLVSQVELATYTAYHVSCTTTIFANDFEDHGFGG